MTDALSFAEIDGQHVELLPARTVLSLFSGCGCGGPEGGDASGGMGGYGGAGEGKASFYNNWIYIEDGEMYNWLTGAQGGGADGGAGSGGAGVEK